MINKIIEGISLALSEEFGEDYKNYTEEVTQDLEKPCFFILCNTPKNELFLTGSISGLTYFVFNTFRLQKISERNAME